MFAHPRDTPYLSQHSTQPRMAGQVNQRRQPWSRNAANTAGCQGRTRDRRYRGHAANPATLRPSSPVRIPRVQCRMQDGMQPDHGPGPNPPPHREHARGAASHRQPARLQPRQRPTPGHDHPRPVLADARARRARRPTRPRPSRRGSADGDPRRARRRCRAPTTTADRACGAQKPDSRREQALRPIRRCCSCSR